MDFLVVLMAIVGSGGLLALNDYLVKTGNVNGERVLAALAVLGFIAYLLYGWFSPTAAAHATTLGSFLVENY